MLCPKCKKPLEDGWACCPYCGKSLLSKPKPHRRRANGEGNIYQPPGCKTFTSRITVGYKKTDHGFTPQYLRAGGFTTRRDAIAAIADLQAKAKEMRKNGLLVQHGLDYSNILFDDLYQKLITRDAKRITKSTLYCYTSAHKYFSDIYHIPFRDLNTEDWQLCIDDCPHGIRTKENMKALGTKMYKLAAELRVFGLSTSTDFATLVWLDREEKESRQPFTMDELHKIIEAADHGVPYADYIKAMCATGFRPTEFLELKHDAYDPKKNTLRGGAKTEAGKNRIVPVHPSIKKFVAEHYLSGSTYLFPDTQGHQFRLDTFRVKCFYPALSLAGIQPIPDGNAKPQRTPYSCRHTFATLMKDVSGSPKDKAALMGHTSFEMTLHYQHEDYESLRSIVEGMHQLST